MKKEFETIVKQKTIISNAWRLMHPHKERFSTDTYYINLANRMLKAVASVVKSLSLKSELAHMIAIASTHYFEDVVSELGLWEAFVSLHKKKYGYLLPFYDTNEEMNYFKGEVNLQDVKFIVWKYVGYVTEDYYLPDDIRVNKIAKAVYDVLDSEFENAPVNDEFYAYLYDEGNDDFVHTKDVLMWLANWNYLYSNGLEHNDVYKKIYDEALEVFENNQSKAKYDAESAMSFQKNVCLFGVKSQNIFSEMCRIKGCDKLVNELNAINSASVAIYLVKKHTQRGTVIVENCMGKEFEVECCSFSDETDWTRINTVVARLVLFKGLWRLNGFAALYKSTESQIKDVFEDERRRIESKNAIPTVSASIKKKWDSLIKKNNGSRMFFFNDVDEALEWEQNCLEMKLPVDFKNEYREDLDGRITLYVGDDYEVIFSSLCDGIKAKHNPYYNPKEAVKDAFKAVTSDGYASIEFMNYLLDNGCFDDAEWKRETDKNKINNNLRFIADMMRLSE